jgi:hypothetical protein
MRWGWLLVLSLAGCGFRSIGMPGDGGCGPDGDMLATCTNTKARGFQPLGNATIDSVAASLAPAGMKTAVVWEDADASPGSGAPSTGRLYVSLVDRLGAPGSARMLGPGRDPVLVRAADQLTLFWRDSDALMMQKMDDTGALLNQARTVLTGTAEGFALVWNESEYGVLLGGANGDPYQIYWLRLSAEGVVMGGPTRLAQGGVNSLQPALAWTGCEWAAAWTDTRPGTPAVFFARFGADFARKSDDVQLSQSGIRGSFPTITAQDTGGIVTCFQELVTTSNQEVVCVRLDGAGAETRREKLSNSPRPSQNPRAVAHGKHTWVLWDDYLQSTVVPSVVWQFLDADGAPVLPSPKIDPDITAGGWRSAPLVTSDALYFSQFFGNGGGSSFSAQIVTQNCY